MKTLLQPCNKHLSLILKNNRWLWRFNNHSYSYSRRKHQHYKDKLKNLKLGLLSTLFDAQLAPQELEINKIDAITKNLREGDEDDKEFERRLKIANIALKEKTLNSQASKGEPSRANDTNRNQQIPRPNQQGVQRPPRQIGLAGEPGQGTRGPTQ